MSTISPPCCVPPLPPARSRPAAPPPAEPLAEATLHVAALAIGDDAIAAGLALIDHQELGRAAAFRFDRDRRRFIARRAQRRRWLGAYVGEAPERLVFTSDVYGKPALAAGGPHFSASHSGDLMMVAIADVAVGCDIEAIDPALDWRPLAERLFAPAERAAIGAMTGDAARRAFFDCWARKEAFVKATGLGLSDPLDAFDVSVGRDVVVVTSEAGWTMRDAPPAPGYAGAIAIRSPAPAD